MIRASQSARNAAAYSKSLVVKSKGFVSKASAADPIAVTTPLDIVKAARENRGAQLVEKSAKVTARSIVTNARKDAAAKSAAAAQEARKRAAGR